MRIRLVAGRLVRRQLLEPDCRIEVITQNRFSGIEIRAQTFVGRA
jgi:hypothetical protein